MVKNNLVSILLSVNNAENTIDTAIKSILNQTHQNFELLIMDDASSDNTFEILQKYISYSNCYLFKNKQNIGLTKSLNILYEKSKGNFIARQDADDISKKKRLEIQLNYINRYELDFCTTRAYVKNSKKIIPGLSSYLPKKLSLRYKNPFIHGTLMIKRNSFKEVGAYNENFKYSQDYKLFMDLIDKGYKFKDIKKPLYILNMNDNISSLKQNQQKYYADCVRKGLKPDIKNENLY
tara:strand:- start:118 stop:825 length:708 start_codon:yes stop_codon:yes gene_type:complete